MLVSPSLAWKLVLGAALLGAIAASQLARAPARPAATEELRRLMICALGLYAVGFVGSLNRSPGARGARLLLGHLDLRAGIVDGPW